MIIWSGFGFLPVIFIFVGGFMGGMLSPMGSNKDIMIAIGMGVAAVANWFAGRRLNQAPGKILIDPATGQEVLFRRRHTLFFIPFEWWTIPIALFAIFLTIPRSLL